MDITNLCRLCGEEKSLLSSLLQNNGNIYIKALINAEVAVEDNLPKNACTNCWTSLKEAYDIQQKFIATDILLHEKLTSSEIKDSKPGSNNDSLLIIKKGDNELPFFDENKLTNNNICTMCGKQYKYLATLEKHSKLVHTNISVNKSIKIEEFSVKTCSNNSIKEICENTEEYLPDKTENEMKCTICGKLYTNKSLYLAHKRNHTQIACSICGAKVSKYYLQAHLKTHTDGPQKCPICYQVLKHKRTLKFHIDTVHNRNTNHTNSQQICYICGKNLKCVRILKKHLKNLHQIGYTASGDIQSSSCASYQCSECDKSFTDRQKYLSHSNNHRKKECPICNHTVSRFNYAKHVKLHSEGPENCLLCGVTCKNSESLRGHMYYTHSTKEFTCSTCNKSFKSNFHRKMHIKLQHTGERNHICDFCGKGFITLYQVKNHIRIHHSESRPYTCTNCDRCFSNIKALLQHERRHSERNYTCGICLETFAKKTDLRTHKSALHKTVEMKRCECPECGKIFSSEFALKKHIQNSHGQESLVKQAVL